jgi:hypothetical protein
MDSKTLSEHTLNGEFDPLSLYHHAASFDSKLQNLLLILDRPKEESVADRFKKIEVVLDNLFRLELIYQLHLKNHLFNSEGGSAGSDSHPQILLHLWCLLGCTDSLECIANYLELTIEEVKELIRELHNTFSIDSLVSRIRQYYEQNKCVYQRHEHYKRRERLGIELSVESKDTTEERKQRLRRRYGHLGTVFYNKN